MIGQHLEQYRHATFTPVAYYEEALRRDEHDMRNNNALGAWYLRRGKFELAEDYLRKAVATSIGRNPNPYDSEPYYNLGLCLQYQERIEEAYTAFYKATWSKAWQDSAFFSVAQIDILRGDYELALAHLDQALDRNMGNSKAWGLKIAVLRLVGKPKEALKVCDAALHRDRFNLGALFEKYLIVNLLGKDVQASTHLDEMLARCRRSDQNLLTYALDYAVAGLFREAVQLLNHADVDGASPMVYYHLALFMGKQDEMRIAKNYLEKAANADSYLCFPNQLEDIVALNFAIKHNPTDAKATYYLGNLWYDKRQYQDALDCWEASVAIDDTFPTAHRNLGIAYFNKFDDQTKALVAFEKAFELDTSDARVLMELDQLYKRLNKQPIQRLQFLETNLATIIERDDLYLERLSIENFLGNHQFAYDLLMRRQFHPWEGGEGKVSGQYVYALTELAKKNIEEKEPTQAIELLENAQIFPHQLGEGKLYGAAENDIFYWMGIAYEQLEKTSLAKSFFEKATVGNSELGAAMFYNDQQPDKIFYQGLAWRKLDEEEKANNIFNSLVTYGRSHADDDVLLDYFAVSLPNLLVFDDDMNLRNQVHCNYMEALGLAGLGEREAAIIIFDKIIEHDAMHFGSISHLKLLKTMKDQFLPNIG